MKNTISIDRSALVFGSGDTIELHWTVKASDGGVVAGTRIGQFSRKINHAVKMDKQYLRRHGFPTGKDAPPMLFKGRDGFFVNASCRVAAKERSEAMKKLLQMRGVRLDNALF